MLKKHFQLIYWKYILFPLKKKEFVLKSEYKKFFDLILYSRNYNTQQRPYLIIINTMIKAIKLLTEKKSYILWDKTDQLPLKENQRSLYLMLKEVNKYIIYLILTINWYTVKYEL